MLKKFFLSFLAMIIIGSVAMFDSNRAGAVSYEERLMQTDFPFEEFVHQVIVHERNFKINMDMVTDYFGGKKKNPYATPNTLLRFLRGERMKKRLDIFYSKLLNGEFENKRAQNQILKIFELYAKRNEKLLEGVQNILSGKDGKNALSQCALLNEQVATETKILKSMLPPNMINDILRKEKEKVINQAAQKEQVLSELRRRIQGGGNSSSWRKFIGTWGISDARLCLKADDGYIYSIGTNQKGAQAWYVIVAVDLSNNRARWVEGYVRPNMNFGNIEKITNLDTSWQYSDYITQYCDYLRQNHFK